MKRLSALLCAVLLAFSVPAAGQMMLMTGAGLGASSSLDAFALAYVTNAVDTTGASANVAVSFAAVDVGTDVSGSNVRYTVIGVGARTSGSSGSFTAANICGVAATEAVTDVAQTNSLASIFYANTSGQGTSCTITATANTATINMGIGVWRVINPTSGTPTANACAGDAATGSPNIVDVNVSAGGGVVGYISDANATDRTFTWNGPTENFDGDIENNSATHSGATGSTSGTPATVRATSSGAGETNACAASWAP